MHTMYNEGMFARLSGQVKKRQVLVFAVAALFLAAAVFTLILDDHKENRPILATTLLVIAGGSVFIFFWDLTVRPLRCYARHMDAALHGRTHQVLAVFDRVGADDSMVDGILFRDLVFLGEADKHGVRDRMFYWDRELPLPDFRPGQEVMITYYDRFMTGYEVIEKG
ncbi:MAG: hypothetical protein IKE24_02250 [Clostridia bacterium]|nr:hypothetical protein [Clostridia bacterium]